MSDRRDSRPLRRQRPPAGTHGRARQRGARSRRPARLRALRIAATIADSDNYVLISEWRDQAALDTHYASPGFARFQFSLNGLLARSSQMTVYTVSGSARPLASGPMDPRDAD